MFRRPMMRVGRPGLLRTVGRTAVVAGTATAVSGGVMRHQQAKAEEQQQAAAYQQQQQWEQQQAAAQQAAAQQAAAPSGPAAGGTDDLIQKLKDLADLKAQGILTDEEFATQKARLLGE